MHIYTYIHTYKHIYIHTYIHTCIHRPGLFIRQSRQMPKAYEGKGPTKVAEEAYKSKFVLKRAYEINFAYGLRQP